MRRERDRFRSSYGLLAIFALFAFGFPRTAHADTFTFTLTSSGVSATGTITTAPLSDGSYTITSITGELNGNPITLLPAGLYPRDNDNLLFVSAPDADQYGIAFAAGGVDYLLFYDTEDEPTAPPALAICTEGPGHCGSGILGAGDAALNGNPGVAVLTYAQAPEPSSLPFLATSLVGIFGMRLRRKLSKRVGDLS
jgi:hypothetical protein